MNNCSTRNCNLQTDRYLNKYNLVEPFEGYMHDRKTAQWIEVGREPDNMELCDVIEEVTDSYIIVSCEGTDRRKFNIHTLEKEEI